VQKDANLAMGDISNGKEFFALAVIVG